MLRKIFGSLNVDTHQTDWALIVWIKGHYTDFPHPAANCDNTKNQLSEQKVKRNMCSLVVVLYRWKVGEVFLLYSRKFRKQPRARIMWMWLQCGEAVDPQCRSLPRYYSTWRRLRHRFSSGLQKQNRRFRAMCPLTIFFSNENIRVYCICQK